jgi:hypothetical protein
MVSVPGIIFWSQWRNVEGDIVVSVLGKSFRMSRRMSEEEIVIHLNPKVVLQN